MDRMKAMMRRLRMEDKAVENQGKPPLASDDVQNAAEYKFSPFVQARGEGDSGTLFLAEKKADHSCRYLVKHAYADCAANEFVYTKLAQAMGFKMPDAVLFRLSGKRAEGIFETEYVLGTSFLGIAVEKPSYAQIREQAKNWQDYFHFLAMYEMMMEGDSFETPLAKDGFLYRIDTTSSFILSAPYLERAGLNITMNGINLKDTVKQFVESYDMDAIWKNGKLDLQLAALLKKYGEECRQPYRETFSRIIEVRQDYVDDFLNTLCYFYPDFIGDYFKRYITALQRQAAQYLREKA